MPWTLARRTRLGATWKTACVLDHLEAARDLAESVDMHLAVLGREDLGDVRSARAHELSDLEHQLRALGERDCPPVAERRLRAGNSPVNLLDRRERDLAALVAERRVVYRPNAARGPRNRGAVEPVTDRGDLYLGGGAGPIRNGRAHAAQLLAREVGLLDTDCRYGRRPSQGRIDDALRPSAWLCDDVRVIVTRPEREPVRWRPGTSTILHASQATGATQVCVIEQWHEPGGGAPTHRHSGSEETLTVLAGTGEFWVGDDREGVDQGATVLVPAGSWHGFQNVGQSVLHILAVLPTGVPLVEYAHEPGVVLEIGTVARERRDAHRAPHRAD